MATQATAASDEESTTIESEQDDCTQSLSKSSSSGTKAVKRKYSRQNTLDEKRKMRRDRLRRKRREPRMLKKKICQLKSELTTESSLRNTAELNVIAFKNRATTFWERWRWELEKRREAMISLLRTRTPATSSRSAVVGQSKFHLQEIDPTMLQNPVICGEEKEHFVGRGSFGIVKVQVFRGILVAVKEYLPRTIKVDIIHEASILSQLCHPYLPLLLGVCTKQQPLRLIMQFHSFKELESSTMDMELPHDRFSGESWLGMCTQLLEAIKYLHEEVSILHNDIKMNNILIAKSLDLSSSDLCDYQVVLIDFGKATKLSEGKRYHLSGVEQAEYVRKFPHIAPEVIEGETKQSTHSDIYSFGKVLFRLTNHGCLNGLHSFKQKSLVTYAKQCTSPSYFSRPSARKGLDMFKTLLDS